MAHDFTLPRRDDKSLIPRLLYKNSYWLVKWESWKTAMLFCLCLCIFIDVLPQFSYLSLLICQCCIIQLRLWQLEFSELNEYRIQLQLTLQHFNREPFVLKPFLSWQKIIVRQATCNSHRMSVCNRNRKHLICKLWPHWMSVPVYLALKSEVGL